MRLRPSTIYAGITAGLALLLSGLFLYASTVAGASGPLFSRKSALVRQLELTDLCLFTEASYTRHPSMSDSATPFQDAPLSFEHFPSGALVTPPSHLNMRRNHD